MSKVKFQSTETKKADINLYGGNLEAFKSRDKTLILVGPAGSGKAQPNDTPIPTPNGWSTMGELKVGDFIFTQSGKITEIIGIFPQGKKLSYRITFNDGTTTECCEEHLWLASTESQRYSYKRLKGIKIKNEIVSEVISTKTIKENIHKNYSITYSGVVWYPTKNLEIDPYLMGIILGDGHVRSATIMISSADEFIVEKVRSKLKRGYSLNKRKDKLYDYIIRNTGSRSEYNKYFRKFGKKLLSNNKFIPREYLENSKENRIQILHGLIDSDGYVDKNGAVSFCSVSEQLCKDVRELVLSLGGIARLTTKKRFYTYNGEKKQGQLAYELSIWLPKEITPCSLPRKTVRLRPTKTNQVKRIVSIEATEEKEMTCLSVDDPSSLYLTNDFIVTHNTLALCMKMHLYCVKYPGVRILLCRKTLPSLRNTVVKTYQDVLTMTGYTDRVRVYGESRPTSFVYQYDTKEYEDGTHYSGVSEIVLSNIAPDSKVLGAEYDMIYINQPDTEGLTEDEFSLVASRCRASNGPYRQIIADPNPASDQHWLLKGSLLQPKTPTNPNGDPKWTMIPSFHKDNPKYFNHDTGEWTLLGLEHLKQLESLPEHLRQSQLEGKWFSTEGAAFSNSWYSPKHVISLSDSKAVQLGISRYNEETEEYENAIPQGWHHYLSIDWGGTDPYAILLIAKHPDLDLFIVHKHIYMVELDIKKVEDLTRQMIEGYNIKDIIADRGPQVTYSMENALGMMITGAKKGAGSGEDSINICNSELLSDRWLFVNTAESLYNIPDRELVNKKRPMGVEEIPDLKLDASGKGIAKHQQDHFFDAWKYFCRYWVNFSTKPSYPALLWL